MRPRQLTVLDHSDTSFARNVYNATSRKILVDSRKSQTSTASPAKPGDLLCWFRKVTLGRKHQFAFPEALPDAKVITFGGWRPGADGRGNDPIQ